MEPVKSIVQTDVRDEYDKACCYTPKNGNQGWWGGFFMGAVVAIPHQKYLWFESYGRSNGLGLWNIFYKEDERITVPVERIVARRLEPIRSATWIQIFGQRTLRGVHNNGQ